MSKSLILDVDGVIIRDRLLLAHVQHNCREYVRHKMPDCKDPGLINRTLYMAHGHTALGLQKAHGKDTSDFNSFVYDKSLLNHLKEVIYGYEFQNDAEKIYDFMQAGWTVTLFTNSPTEWVIPVARAIGDAINISCSEPLKPGITAYKRFPSDQTHIFVDDSLKNLVTARHLTNWRPVLFGSKDEETFCPVVDSIDELGLLLDTVLL